MSLSLSSANSLPLYLSLPPSSCYLSVKFIGRGRKWGEETQAAAGVSIMNMLNTWNIIKEWSRDCKADKNQQTMLVILHQIFKRGYLNIAPCWRKPENLLRTHADMGKTCKLNTERLDSNLGLSCYEVTNHHSAILFIWLLIFGKWDILEVYAFHLTDLSIP